MVLNAACCIMVNCLNPLKSIAEYVSAASYHPYCFLLSHRNKGLRWTMNSFLQHLDYADDICLLSHKMSDLQDMICSLEKEAASAGLKINGGKTKLLSLTGSVNRIVKVAGVQIEAVNHFAYFGSIIAAGGGTDMNIENRINKARVAFGILSVVWRNNNFSTSLKLRLFKSNVVSVLLYGCCTWKISKAVTSRLQVFINRCLRSTFRINWPNRITNEELLRRAETEAVEIRIRRQK